MPPTDHQLWPTRVERWGRRLAMAGFALFGLIDVLIAYSSVLNGPQTDSTAVWLGAGALLVADAVVLAMVFRHGDLWRRCLIGGITSLLVSAAMLSIPGTGGGGLVEEAGLFCLLLLGARGLSPGRGRVVVGLIGLALLAE